MPPAAELRLVGIRTQGDEGDSAAATGPRRGRKIRIGRFELPLKFE